jgi:hypothetical protein
MKRNTRMRMSKEGPSSKPRISKSQLDEGTELPDTSTIQYPTEKGGVAFTPTKKEAIQTRALSMMEQQVDLQMENIREQITLLAKQVEELETRKAVSKEIYHAAVNFEPVVGKTYYLYDRVGEGPFLSLISPEEWGNNPNVILKAKVLLLGDHTWKVLD